MFWIDDSNDKSTTSTSRLLQTHQQQVTFQRFWKKIATHLRFLAFCIHSEFKLTMSVYAQTTFSRRRRLIVISLRTVVYHCLLPVVHFFFFPDPFGESRSSSPTRTRRARCRRTDEFLADTRSDDNAKSWGRIPGLWSRNIKRENPVSPGYRRIVSYSRKFSWCVY